MKPKATCRWKFDVGNEYSGDKWDGACGVAWSLDGTTLAENNMNFCPKCGGKIIAQSPQKGRR